MARSDTVAAGMSAEESASLGLVAGESRTAHRDDQVRAAVQAGDHRGALTMLMNGYGRAVHRYCASLLRDAERAEDALQAVFISAFQALPTFQERSGFKTWLLAIARNRCLDQLRRKQRWNRIAGQIEMLATTSAAAQSGEPPGRPDLGPALEECLARLAPGARDTVLLRYREDLSYQEMAEVIGSTAGALRVKVLRALEALRACLKKKGASHG